MKADTLPPETIDEYIAGFLPAVQVLLHQLRATIKQAAPEAGEAIRYRMPTFTLNGNLVHFAAYKNHIGLYPTPAGINAFRAKLAGYKSAKGSVQFPLDKPLPLDLISRIVLARVHENREKAAAKP
jgi:uncharacterized protein YdhG (YjbR/CyaY superfamily)